MWGKRTENQFSIFRTENARFCERVFQRFGRDKSCPNHSPRNIRNESNKNGLYYRKSMPAGKIIENSYKFNNVNLREFVYLCDCLLL